MSALRHEMTLMITTESLGFGTFVVDGTHRIVSWNGEAARTLGYDADATLGRTCEEMLAILHAQDVPVCPELINHSGMADSATTLHAARRHPGNSPSTQRQGSTPARLQVVTRHGTKRWLDLSILRARTLDGSDCILHVFRDVTEQADQPEHDNAVSSPTRQPGNVSIPPLGAFDAKNCTNSQLSAPEHLTPREHEVLALLSQGMATIDIAGALGISRVTARNHVTRVIEKLGVKTRLQAVLAASRYGLI